MSHIIRTSLGNKAVYVSTLDPDNICLALDASKAAPFESLSTAKNVRDSLLQKYPATVLMRVPACGVIA